MAVPVPKHGSPPQPMRPLPVPALAVLALLAAVPPAAAEDAGSRRDPRYVWGGVLTGEEWYAPIYDRPIFAPLPFAPELEAHAPLLAQAPDASEPSAASAAAAAPAPATPAARGEPIGNGDYWLNYLFTVPRFFTAPTRFDTGDWLLTGAFVAVAGGAFLADEDIRRFFRDNRSGASDALAAVGYRLGDGKTIAGATALAYAAGFAAGDTKLRETALLALQSWVLTAGATEGIKYLAGRERPNATDDHTLFLGPGNSGKSFPSGHASNAFAVASVVAEQYGEEVWVAPVAYGLAGLVAWSRLNDNAHWASDVVVGAGLGYAIGKLVTHFSPFRDQPGMSLTPLGLPGGGGLQLGFRF